MKTTTRKKAPAFSTSVVLISLCYANAGITANPLETNSPSAGADLPKTEAEKLQSNPLGSSLWHSIADRESKINRTQNHWRRRFVVKGHPMTAEQRSKEVAAQEDRFLKNKFLNSEAKRMANELVKETEEGITMVSDLHMIRMGDFRKATVTTQTQPMETQNIDIFDGVKQGHFQRIGSRASKAPNTKLSYSWSGEVSLDKRFAMDRSANAGLDILLMQMPLKETFDPLHSQWDVKEDAFVVSTRNREGGNLRLMLSRRTGCPVSLVRLHPVTQQVLYVHQITKTQIVDGVELPSEIVSYRSKEGSLANYEFKYELISSKMNDKVSNSEALLPPGTQVSDYRLGLSNVVTYEATDGKLLTDDQVKKLNGEMLKEASALKEDKAAAEAPQPSRLVHLLGLCCLFLGGILLIKGKRT